MKKWILASIACLFLSGFTTVWADVTPDTTAAQTVIENWFAAMKDQQIDKASNLLAPQFTSIHTDGIVRDKNQELDLIKKLQMKAYHLSDFKFSQSDNVIVVTFKDKGIEKIDKKSIGEKTAGRMAVLEKKGNDWVVLAYANLDRIG